MNSHPKEITAKRTDRVFQQQTIAKVSGLKTFSFCLLTALPSAGISRAVLLVLLPMTAMTAWLHSGGGSAGG